MLNLADLHTIKIYLQEFFVETSQTGVQCDCFINQLIIGTMHVCAIYGSDGLIDKVYNNLLIKRLPCVNLATTLYS